MDEEIKTIILRFRDFAHPSGFTVREHNSIVESCGYVWWGWWNKHHESANQVAELRSLGYNAKEQGIQILLVDTGQYKLYKSICSDIAIYSEARLSPEISQTPQYYNALQYNMWFRLGEITECSESELRGYSYCEIRSFFTDSSDYSVFHGKVVYSIRELSYQERTIWFVREAVPSDPVTEIILLEAGIVQPYHFSQKYYHAPGNKLLWLSDLHLAEDVFPKNAGEYTLLKHLSHTTNDYHDIGGVLISGDITSFGKKEGFEEAKRLLDDINSTNGGIFKAENIAICPGNHDLRRKESEFDLAGGIPERVSDNPECIEDYGDFYQQLYHLGPNEYLACGKKLVLPSGVTVEIACINSLLLQQYKNFEGHGFISQEQMDYVEKQMGWDQQIEPSSIRIVMMHHHYMPTCYAEKVDVAHPSSVVYDADNLMHWMIKNNVSILLHGHKHKRFVAQIVYPKETNNAKITLDRTAVESKKITILGMGGTAARCSENVFAIISIYQKEIVVEFHAIYPNREYGDGVIQTIHIER